MNRQLLKLVISVASKANVWTGHPRTESAPSPASFYFYIRTSADPSVKLPKFAKGTTVPVLALPYLWRWQAAVQTWGKAAGCLVQLKQPGAKCCKNCKDEGRPLVEPPPSHRCFPIIISTVAWFELPGFAGSFGLCWNQLQHVALAPEPCGTCTLWSGSYYTARQKNFNSANTESL